jgi:hypothetical protein
VSLDTLLLLRKHAKVCARIHTFTITPLLFASVCRLLISHAPLLITDFRSSAHGTEHKTVACMHRFKGIASINMNTDSMKSMLYPFLRMFVRLYLHISSMLLLVCMPSLSTAIDLPGFAMNGNKDLVTLVVAEPFIEMHTGPGRGYPVFHVVEHGETVEVIKRKAGWYKLRSADNKTGWTRATQLAHTLKPTGIPVDLPEVSRGDYLKSHWLAGFSAGQLEGANTVSLSAGYRPLSWAGLEIEGGKIFDESVTSDFYGASFLVEPRPHWFISPFFSAGIGKFSFNDRQKVLVEDGGSSDYVSIAAGAGYYIVRNLVVRAQYRRYSVSTDGDDTWLNGWTVGLSAFF